MAISLLGSCLKMVLRATRGWSEDLLTNPNDPGYPVLRSGTYALARIVLTRKCINKYYYANYRHDILKNVYMIIDLRKDYYFIYNITKS
jgi:hypothetical protein